ncbi:alpha/beta hydrolase [Actinomyces faecalis]|uniref:alpha/beta hydrolase n=1 Tax=Actinomyces faecalis TaxID=2722820 RepID=UPI0015536CE9|nr:alpha/beta hydrolase [Actinomyces faecalis]
MSTPDTTPATSTSAPATAPSAAATTQAATPPSLTMTSQWDKTFPRSQSVEHAKTSFPTGYGLTLAADLYRPTNTDAPLPAIAVCGPFGAVKEQSSGLYAQTMAERGFLTIAFDPSYTGESSGSPRYIASPDINTEDFMSAVDYLTTRPDVDADRIGIIGICGWGGIALNAAAADPRIKATVASTMYDMTRTAGNGYFDADDDPTKRLEARRSLAAQRTATAATGARPRMGGVVDPLPDNALQFVKDYHAYYKTERGFHPRSLNSTDGWATTGIQAYANARFLYYIGEIENAVLVLHGEKAHSRYMGETAYEKMASGIRPENKELVIVPGASHTDLYDGGAKHAVPWERLTSFFTQAMQR